MLKGFKMKIALGLLILIGFVYFISFAGINEILTPLRVDSLYVKAQETDYLRQLENTDIKIAPHFFHSPADFHLCFSDIEIRTADSLKLKGWYIPSDNYNSNSTLVIIHDLNDSRITLLETAKQFNDRGYSVCLFDMRAHGASDGKQATFGFLEKYDVITIIDTITKQYGSKNIVLMGLGVGASIAIQAASIDSRVKVIIAQSPFSNLLTFVKTFADQKWDVMNKFLFPLIKKHLEKELLFSVETIDIAALAKNLTIPVFFIAGGQDKTIDSQETHQVFEASTSNKKQFWLIKNAGHTSIEETAGPAYYNKISVFIINNSPRRNIKTRFKRYV
jgi:alpha-beta hydrolase superfamily lysophospholipase